MVIQSIATLSTSDDDEPMDIESPPEPSSVSGSDSSLSSPEQMKKKKRSSKKKKKKKKPDTQEQQEEQQCEEKLAAPKVASKPTPPVEETLVESRAALSKESGAKPARGPSRREPRKRTKNEFFKDVDATGKWGSLSSKEIVLVSVVTLVVAIAIVMTVLFLFVFNDDHGAPLVTTTSAPTPAPTPAPTVKVNVPPEVQLEALLGDVAANPFTDVGLLPDLVSSYQGEAMNPDASPMLRAVSWLLFDDPADLAPTDNFFIDRFALAVMYYAMGGDEWIHKTGWLQESNPCLWYGISCDRFSTVLRGIDLPANNMVGTIPSEINMLSTLRFLRLRENHLGGTIPLSALGTLPELSILYLDSNQLTGTLNENLRANGLLNTIYLQDNNITGRWPRRQWCPRTGDPPIIQNFGLDCKEIIGCPPTCCSENQCFD